MGDIHANIEALEAAIVLIESLKPDCVVLIGDLLTYGTAVNEVLETVRDFSLRSNVFVLRGNHDLYYQQMLRNKKLNNEYMIAEFVTESILWTSGVLAPELFHSILFMEELVVGKLHFAHANPWRNDYVTYINDNASRVKAARDLDSMGINIGCYGHTHRPELFDGSNGCVLDFEPKSGQFLKGGPFVVNVGSIGQPRGTFFGPCVVQIDTTRSGASVSFIPIKYDVSSHLARIKGQHSLSRDTKNRLLSYFATTPRI